MEYYELYKLDETIPLKKQNPFAPKPPFRLGVAGTSESGKTACVVIKYQKVGAKILVKAMDKQAPWYENVRFKLIAPEELILHLSKELVDLLLVFDDLAGEPLATQLKIVPFFRSGRHEGISSIYIAQRFYDIHPNMRANLKYISLHRGCGTLVV
ncbi:72_t:CDS:2 [Acaulospora morrowiae]|uniref:72_t:CDS:1 n=1 Tax=Acaulospora morrowiae TaxID=94023 RepID=A0A9N9D0N9_9GLOM|nr:72_t:CDS:2 [Acaulospora morrowiae]